MKYFYTTINKVQDGWLLQTNSIHKTCYFMLSRPPGSTEKTSRQSFQFALEVFSLPASESSHSCLHFCIFQIAIRGSIRRSLSHNKLIHSSLYPSYTAVNAAVVNKLCIGIACSDVGYTFQHKLYGNEGVFALEISLRSRRPITNPVMSHFIVRISPQDK